MLRFFRENPVAVVFGTKFIGFAIFGISWYHSVNFKIETLEGKISRQSSEIEQLKSVNQRAYPKNISMVIADRDSHISGLEMSYAKCSESLNDTRKAVNAIYTHHKRCVEREKSIKYAAF